MLTSFSKLLANRIAQAQQSPSAHPPADTLNAFAENHLPPGERQTVLAHLAACPDCREVLSLIAPETPLHLSSKSTWQNLRWPLAAAATLLLTFTVLHHKPAPPLPPPPVSLSVPKPAPAQSSAPAPVARVAPKKNLSPLPPAVSLAEENSPEKFDYARAQTASSFRNESFALNKLRIAPATITAAQPTLVSGSNIWLAGEVGTLVHSTDKGAHWDQITVSDGSTELKEPIIAIQALPRSHTIRLKTPSGFWTTTDNGKTWRKEKSSP